MTTQVDQMVQRLRAERAKRVAAGDKLAIMMQAAEERAEARQREEDRREADRIRRLLADNAKAEPATVKPTRRKRRPDFVEQVKRATAAGLNVTAATVTADSVVMTFGETEVPAPIDASVIETADELRGLI